MGEILDFMGQEILSLTGLTQFNCLILCMLVISVSSNIGALGLSFNSMNFCHEQMYNIMPIKIILMS